MFKKKSKPAVQMPTRALALEVPTPVEVQSDPRDAFFEARLKQEQEQKAEEQRMLRDALWPFVETARVWISEIRSAAAEDQKDLERARRDFGDDRFIDTMIIEHGQLSQEAQRMEEGIRFIERVLRAGHLDVPAGDVGTYSRDPVRYIQKKVGDFFHRGTAAAMKSLATRIKHRAELLRQRPVSLAESVSLIVPPQSKEDESQPAPLGDSRLG